jgi:hypothetical protein
VLFKDPVPAIDTRLRDRESKTDIFYIPATVPEIESTGLPVRTYSAVDHGIEQLYAAEDANDVSQPNVTYYLIQTASFACSLRNGNLCQCHYIWS